MIKTDLHVELVDLIESLQFDLQNDHCLYGDDYEDLDDIAVNVTVGTDENMENWGYQTGDNSFAGGVYGFPHWAVITLTLECDSQVVAKEIIDQWEDLISQVS